VHWLLNGDGFSEKKSTGKTSHTLDAKNPHHIDDVIEFLDQSGVA